MPTHVLLRNPVPQLLGLKSTLFLETNKFLGWRLTVCNHARKDGPQHNFPICQEPFHDRLRPSRVSNTLPLNTEALNVSGIVMMQLSFSAQLQCLGRRRRT